MIKYFLAATLFMYSSTSLAEDNKKAVDPSQLELSVEKTDSTQQSEILTVHQQKYSSELVCVESRLDQKRVTCIMTFSAKEVYQNPVQLSASKQIQSSKK